MMTVSRVTAQSTNSPSPSPLEITKDDIYLFGHGSWLGCAEKMGAHPDTVDGHAGWRFAVWAPQVRSVSVVGDFNGWEAHANPLNLLPQSDIWQGFIPGLQMGDLYKFAIETDSGEILLKADPFAVADECPPNTASKLWTLDGYTWQDAAWLKNRSAANHMEQPLNIYEVHLGSWKRHGDEPQGEPREDGTWPGPGDPFPAQRGTYYTYDDLARELVPYVRDMGYTHIEIMPVTEHPFDGSWGYQTTGYYATTARFGTPQQFMHLVDAAHQAGIGMIMDWVPGGFCADSHGLATFNGHMLYEHEIHPNWGTHKFDFSKPEVVSFLTANALFWLEHFHIDGIRMDGVTSMLYLNFGISDESEKHYNERGTEEDLDASAFIRTVNTCISERFSDVMMIAEESTAWPLVTYPPEKGGLGFHYKWDMGWMNDTLHYMQTDFPWRPGNHGLLTFSLMYAFNENFVLPLSHDEVVNGKCSLIGRMPGDWWRQFAGMRTLAFYQMTHPGAKLNFMGNEIAQFIEWRYYESIQWFMAQDYETHAHQQAFVKAVNHLYTAEPALYERSYTPDGFEWIDADNNEQSIITFVRHGNDPKDDLVVLINFDPASYESYRIGVPREGDWELIFNSDLAEFGGSSYPVPVFSPSQPKGWNGRADSIETAVPGLSGLVFKRRGPSSYKPPKPAEPVATKKPSTTTEATKKTKVAKATGATRTHKPKSSTKKEAATKSSTSKITGKKPKQ